MEKQKLYFSKGYDIPAEDNENGGATAGISVTKQVTIWRAPWVQQETHENRIEIYGDTDELAQALRDRVLAVLQETEITE